MDRDFARSEMALNRGFGDSFGRMGMVTVKVPVANFSSIGTVLIGGEEVRGVVSFGHLPLSHWLLL